MLKRYVYMGEDGVDAVYFDSREKKFYQKPKGRFIDTKRSQRGPLIVGLFGLFSLATGGHFERKLEFLTRWGLPDSAPVWLSYVIIVVIAVSLSAAVAWFLSNQMYGDMSRLRVARYGSVREAFETDTFLSPGIWGNKHGVTVFNYAVAIVGNVTFLACDFGVLYALLTQFLPRLFEGQAPDPGQGILYYGFLGVGLLLGSYIILWSRNPLLLLHVARRFWRGDYEFSDESVKRA